MHHVEILDGLGCPKLARSPRCPARRSVHRSAQYAGRLLLREKVKDISYSRQRAESTETRAAAVAFPGKSQPSPPPPPAIAAAPPPPAPACLAPPAAYLKVVALGADKAILSTSRTLVLALLAGAYISFGVLLALSIGGACPSLAQSNPGLQKLVLGAVGLPTGSLMVLVCGAEMFTGNVALLTAAWLEGKATPPQVLRNWVLSYVGNFAGALLLVKLVTVSGLLTAAAAPLKYTAVKTSLTFAEAFSRGILANWLVCIAVWQASAAASLPGKALGVLLPVSAFVAMGMENSVANMFMIPMGIACGAEVSARHFLLSNLLPVTLGNIVGGAVCVALPYALAFGRKPAAA